MKQAFGFLTFVVGGLILIVSICVQLEFLDGYERLGSARAFLMAFVFLVFGWDWMQGKVAE